MINFIPTYLINTSADTSGDFEKWIRKQPFYYKAGVIFLSNTEDFFKIFESRHEGFSFRVLIHPGLTGNSNIDESDLIDVEAIHNTFHSKSEFTSISIPLITRANFLKRQKELNKNDIHFNHLGYRFYYAPYCSTDDFINDIPIFKKKSQKTITINNTSNVIKGESIDYVIQTALYYNELEEIKVAFDLKDSDQFEFGNYVGYKFVFNGKKILAVSQHDMGMIDSSILATEIAIRFNPKFLIMPGVCGGNEKTNFGDIIISKKISLFQNGKITDNGHENESVEARVDDKILQKITLKESDIVSEIKDEILEIIDSNDKRKSIFEPFKDLDFKARPEPTACSTMVIDKKGYFDEFIKSINRKTIAVEMEGYGMLRASQMIDNRTKALLIKSVMDKTSEKNDNAKAFAAFISAQFVKKIIQKEILE